MNSGTTGTSEVKTFWQSLHPGLPLGTRKKCCGQGRNSEKDSLGGEACRREWLPLQERLSIPPLSPDVSSPQNKSLSY